MDGDRVVPLDNHRQALREEGALAFFVSHLRNAPPIIIINIIIIIITIIVIIIIIIIYWTEGIVQFCYFHASLIYL